MSFAQKPVLTLPDFGRTGFSVPLSGAARPGTQPSGRSRPGRHRRAAPPMREMKRAGQLWRFSRLRQCKYPNNIVEQDHRRIKRLVRPGLGFGSLPTAGRTLAGYEAMAMVRKGQVHNVGGQDIKAQATFVVATIMRAAGWMRG